MDIWESKNRRRINLIEKKSRLSLNSEETAELRRLKAEMASHVRSKAPRSTEALEQFELHVKGMKADATISKVKMP